MSLNDPTARGSVRFPYVRATCNGVEIPGLKSATVNTNGFWQASTFNLTFAQYADPSFPNTIWSKQNTVLLNVEFGLASTSDTASIQWQSFIIGEVSAFSCQNGEIQVSGADLSSRLIATKTVTTYRNQTASEIATLIAQKHGLTLVVDATTTPVGRYYSSEFVSLNPAGAFSRTTTEFDLLVMLAKAEGFDFYVQGTSLYFQKPAAQNSNPWVVQVSQIQRIGNTTLVGQSNAIGLSLKRSFTIAKDIKVIVNSYNSKKAKTVSGSYGFAKTNPTNSNQNNVFVFNVPNLSEQQCLDLAKAKAEEISVQEREISWQEPGSFVLQPRNLVRLEGEGVQTDFAQTYYVYSITRTLSTEGGFIMQVTARNHSPQLETNSDSLQ